MSHIEDTLRVLAVSHAVLTIGYRNDRMVFTAMLTDDAGEVIRAQGDTLEELLSELNERVWDEFLVDQ